MRIKSGPKSTEVRADWRKLHQELHNGSDDDDDDVFLGFGAV